MYDTSFTAASGAIPLHLLLAAVLVIGATFRDPFAEFLQGIGAFLLAAIAILLPQSEAPEIDGLPLWLKFAYQALAMAVAIGYGRWVHNKLYLAGAILIGLCWVQTICLRAYHFLRPLMAGLDYVLWGAVSLFVAMLISLAKAGWLRRWVNRNKDA